MSSLAFFALIVQACLIQNVLSACYGAGPAGAYPWNAVPYTGYGAYNAPYLAEPFGYAGFDYGYSPCAAAYGGAGAGNVAVAGELPVGGATAVAGQVPIIGAVEYAGVVPAAGAVTISGSCACGCGPYY